MRAQHEPGHVPQLVSEVAGVLELLGTESGVVPRRRAVHQREPQRVGTDLLDRLERIDRIALRLGHLLAVRVADQTRQIDGMERRLAG